MRRAAVLAVLIGVLSISGYLTWRYWSASRVPSANMTAASSGAAPPAASGTPGAEPTAASSAGDPAAPLPVPSSNVNVASTELGARIESVTSENNQGDQAAVHLIDLGSPARTCWIATSGKTQEVVISFFERQPVLVSSVLINPKTYYAPARWAKDVEVWVSTESPASGFTKVASASLPAEDADHAMTFAPIEVKFVKLRVLSPQAPGEDYVGAGKMKVIEASRAGYTPLLVRNPMLAALVGGAAPDAVFSRGSAAALPSPAVAAPGMPAGSPPPGQAALDACAAPPPAPPAPLHRSSARVLVVAKDDRSYPPVKYARDAADEKQEASFYRRVTFTVVHGSAASPLLLLPEQGFDTVVLSQVCDIKTSVPESFKRALVQWIGQGHKLIIHDSDECAGQDVPDYGFLPYRFVTSNPGRHGARSETLTVVESNTLASVRQPDESFLDVEAWTKFERNELGDANTITEFDPRWCGQIVTKNVLDVNGFVEAYAHYGRGLIIYNGFDKDEAGDPNYRQLVTRELAQPFDPDGLPCSARLSDFVISTDAALKRQFMAAGRVYQYPVTLLSIQGYKGTVRLSAGVVPPDPAVTAAIERDSVEVTDASTVKLTVTSSGNASPAGRVVSVRGTDASGRTGVLCLQLEERTSGSLRVTTDFARPAGKPRKNLEVILDLSGSMKQPLGRSTRMDTARRVLRDVLAKVPDDYNVGLRLYGHRYGSQQKQTCTDSELVVPIGRLDRRRVLSVVDSAKPRGETPLVYSVLQAAGDLKSAGGGSIVLVTDGEESCGGDPVAAAHQIEAAGVDVNLQIVGFTIAGKAVQQQLTRFAEGTGGRYHSAQDGETLARALLIAAVEKMPFEVFDAGGQQVAKGETDSPAVELPPGSYRVVIQAPGQELVAGNVTIGVRGDAALKIVLKGDRFELER